MVWEEDERFDKRQKIAIFYNKFSTLVACHDRHTPLYMTTHNHANMTNF